MIQPVKCGSNHLGIQGRDLGMAGKTSSKEDLLRRARSRVLSIPRQGRAGPCESGPGIIRELFKRMSRRTSLPHGVPQSTNAPNFAGRNRTSSSAAVFGKITANRTTRALFKWR